MHLSPFVVETELTWYKHMKRVTKTTLAGCLVGTLSLTGCVGDSADSSDTTGSGGDFDFVGMLANYADNIIIPNYQTTAANAQQLAASNGPLMQYCNAIGSGDEASAFSAASTAWQDLQSAIQISESHVIGPAANNTNLLRNSLNSYHAGPLSTCGIDQSVVLASQDSSFDVSARTVTQRGIGAVEYLLFNNNLDHTCPSQITETSDWNSRPAQERKQLRCEYALTLSQDISNTAESIADAWDINGDDYRSQFIHPNQVADNFSALSDALFFMDVEVKDNKLGTPIGISNACTDFACPSLAESPYSQRSLQNIQANVEGFSQMLTGGSGLGFDDIIAQAGLDSLNSDFNNNITDALNTITTASESLTQQASAITDQNAETACSNAAANPVVSATLSACHLYGFVKRITDDLKVGFVSAVNVDLPERAQSDAD